MDGEICGEGLTPAYSKSMSYDVKANYNQYAYSNRKLTLIDL